MANYNSTANVVLTVNGKQAQQMLTKLQREAANLEKKIAAAATAGDKATMKKLQRELTNTNRILDQLRGSASTAEQVLLRLDKATPRELQRTLKTLQSQLNGLQRGTAAWDAHVAKIRAVKNEIDKVNASIRTQQSLWTRINTGLNNAQTFIFGAIAALSGLVMAGRKAVNAYASMEEQLANTRKYTRMTEEDVLKLNESFMKMDTRLPREQLNLLAQEAGRLGKNTVDSVKQYVEAAAIINVALVDLGEGATQTIAKISNIFGMEDLYGVKEAMLKVGSTVNVLSQNCTASKPFIVEFTQRMAGIGSTAKMTIPEIMAFAATLDANGQKVEMSASALGRLVMKLYQDPLKIAKEVGLNVEYFTKVLANDTTKGVMMFLEQINKIGEDQALAALAPLFKDLGMDGVRMSQVLSNLAAHLDMVRWEMGEANKAFREGKSASGEYAIFNNTVQAQLDKAKNRVHELAVELGESLLPIMRHIYTSSSMFLRMLNTIVNFVVEYRGIIGTLTTAIISYYVAIGISKTVQLAWNASIALGKSAVVAFNYVVGLCKVGIIALTQGTAAANTALKALNLTIKMNPFGAVAAVVTTLVVAIYNLTKATDNAITRMQDAGKAAGEFSEDLIKEQTELDILFGKLKGCNEGSKLYEETKQQLINQYGKYLSGLIDEEGKIIDLTAAYNRLSKAVERSVKVRGIQNAKQTIVDEYSKTMSESLNDLQSLLVFYGKDQAKAAEVVAQVAEAMGSGKAIPESAAAYINSLSGMRSGGEGFDKIKSWFNNSQFGQWVGNLFGNRSLSPAEITNNMYNIRETKDSQLSNLESMLDGADPLRNVGRTELGWAIESLRNVVDSGKGGSALVHESGNTFNYMELTLDKAKQLLLEYQEELALRGEPTPNIKEFTDKDYPTSTSDSGNGTKDKFEKEKEWKAIREAYALISKATGQKADKDGNIKSYSAYDYQNEMDSINVGYYEKILEREDLTWLERLQMQAKYQDALAKKVEDYNNESLELEERAHDKNLMNIRQAYANNLITSEQFNEQLEDEDVRHLGKIRDIRRKIAFAKQEEWENSDKTTEKPPMDFDAYNEYVKANEQYLQRTNQVQEKKYKEQEKLAAEHQKKMEKMRDYMLPDDKKRSDYNADLAILKEVYDQELLLAGDNAERKLQIEEAYQLAKLALAKKYNQLEQTGFQGAIAKSAEWLQSDGGKALTGTVSTLASGMSNIFSQVTSMMQADLEIQTSAIEKRYEAEISAAEGNSYLVAKLEKQKEEEVAKAKNEANRKMFVMEVLQAVAQTATNAINAYGSAAAIPVTGWLMAPIAASMAVAAGMLQIAAIKKQQQASEASGYSEGGFTPDGRVDEPVGIVHAGEWVASQRLTKNPQTRPLLEALDYAQRNNTIGSLTAADVSRSITAPMLLATQQSASPTIVNNYTQVARESSATDRVVAVLDRLDSRLNEPFVTVNTITGDLGIQKAQDDYNKLIKNKSPKSRR